ncbi:MAG: CehA/McbA family metallohydrolase [Bryobacterales bacterium]|nr:CehA/McbA family metallohydrolase [Bryobacterales bacterium]
MSPQRRRLVLAISAIILLGAAGVATRQPASGQAAVSLSRPGQEDLSFWVNHNGLVQYDAEGEVGFGDMARILLRRRSNAALITPLRDRFTFRVKDAAALDTPDLFRLEIAGGTPRWVAAPAARFVAGSSRTFQIPVVIRNRDAQAQTVALRFANASMESAAAITVAGGAAAGAVLRAVETGLGSSTGELTATVGGESADTGVHFDIRPLVTLRVKVADERGRPTVARVYLTGSDGLSYAPGGSSARIMAMSAEYFFHADGEFEIRMPAGETLIEAAKGPEYRLEARRVVLGSDGPAEAALRLQRWTAPREKGWWSGDVHIHANYTSPHHQTIEPRDVRLQVEGEDLNYANMMVANSSGAFLHDRQYFEARPHRLSSPGHFIYWNEENRSSAYGHMCFLGLKKLVEPFYNGFRNTAYWDDYPANFTLSEQVFEQGGAVSYAHPGMQPVFEGASIRELPVDLALGQQTAMDVLSNNDETATTEMWYRLLNCGFRVGISAGTDAFTNVADHYVAGGNRVYVKTGERFDYGEWLDGFRRGRSFASNGPVVALTVNGKEPGEEIHSDGPLEVTVNAEALSQTPLDRVEVMVNGKAARVVEGGSASFRLAVKESSWIALRALGPPHRLVLNDTQAYAHTSPVYVTIGRRPVRIAADIRFYRNWVEKLIARVEKNGRFATPERRKEVLALFHKGLDWYRRAEGK